MGRVMKAQDLNVLNQLIDSLTFDYGMTRNGASVYFYYNFFDFKLNENQKKMLEEAFESFGKEIIGPIIKVVNEKFRGMIIDEWLINRVRGHFRLKEERIIEAGGLSFHDEIKKRLGILPEFDQMNSELENIFNKALYKS